MANNTQRDNGRLIGGGILIGLGILFLGGQFFDIGDLMSTFWPFFIMAPGLAFLATAFLGDKKQAPFIIPGAMVTGTGAILLYQNMTGHWESWAYLWTLYPIFLGMAFNFMSQRTGDNSIGKVGRGFVTWGLIGLVALSVLFEFFIFGSMGWIGSLLVPAAMILGGIYLLTRGRSNGPAIYFSDKVKRSSARMSTGPTADISPELKRKIDQALMDEPEEQTI